MSNKSIFELASAEAPQTSQDFKPAPENIKTRFGNLGISQRLSDRK